MSTFRRIMLALVAAALLAAACGEDETDVASTGNAPDGSEQEAGGESAGGESAGGDAEGRVEFVAPADGDIVAQRFTVEMAADGVTVEPAGEVRDGAGHLHVMIDTDCVTPGEVVPSDDEHRHFGDGSTAAQLFLEPGEHDLCLQLADGAHVATAITDQISVEVDGDLPFVTLEVPEGETVTSPVALEMSANAMVIEEAGTVTPNTGHFHVMVDTDCVDVGEVISSDDQHLHFGDGSTSTALGLEPGDHTLCLQVGDGEHVATEWTHTVKLVVA